MVNVCPREEFPPERTEMGRKYSKRSRRYSSTTIFPSGTHHLYLPALDALVYRGEAFKSENISGWWEDEEEEEEEEEAKENFGHKNESSF